MDKSTLYINTKTFQNVTEMKYILLVFVCQLKICPESIEAFQLILTVSPSSFPVSFLESRVKLWGWDANGYNIFQNILYMMFPFYRKQLLLNQLWSFQKWKRRKSSLRVILNGIRVESFAIFLCLKHLNKSSGWERDLECFIFSLKGATEVMYVIHIRCTWT